MSRYDHTSQDEENSRNAYYDDQRAAEDDEYGQVRQSDSRDISFNAFLGFVAIVAGTVWLIVYGHNHPMPEQVSLWVFFAIICLIFVGVVFFLGREVYRLYKTLVS
jgi:hypothetical protein